MHILHFAIYALHYLAVYRLAKDDFVDRHVSDSNYFFYLGTLACAYGCYFGYGIGTVVILSVLCLSILLEGYYRVTGKEPFGLSPEWSVLGTGLYDLFYIIVLTVFFAGSSIALGFASFSVEIVLLFMTIYGCNRFFGERIPLFTLNFVFTTMIYIFFTALAHV